MKPTIYLWVTFALVIVLLIAIYFIGESMKKDLRLFRQDINIVFDELQQAVKQYGQKLKEHVETYRQNMKETFKKSENESE